MHTSQSPVHRALIAAALAMLCIALLAQPRHALAQSKTPPIPPTAPSQPATPPATPPASPPATPPATPPAAAPAPSLGERIAAMKKALLDSRAALKSYEWIETTVVLLKGEEKATIQKRCYFGADGKVQKLTIAAPPEAKPKGGLRGKIIEKKKEELSDYMKQAIERVHQYIPPDPEAIQKAKDAGNASIVILEPGKRIRLVFKDYLTPGDELNAEMTLADNRLAAIGVSTFLAEANAKAEAKNPITLAVRMGTLDDGASYAAETTLEAKAKAKAKDLKVIVTNSGYRKMQ